MTARRQSTRSRRPGQQQRDWSIMFVTSSYHHITSWERSPHILSHHNHHHIRLATTEYESRFLKFLPSSHETSDDQFTIHWPCTFEQRIFLSILDLLQHGHCKNVKTRHLCNIFRIVLEIKHVTTVLHQMSFSRNYSIKFLFCYSAPVIHTFKLRYNYLYSYLKQFTWIK